MLFNSQCNIPLLLSEYNTYTWHAIIQSFITTTNYFSFVQFNSSAQHQSPFIISQYPFFQIQGTIIVCLYSFQVVKVRVYQFRTHAAYINLSLACWESNIASKTSKKNTISVNSNKILQERNLLFSMYWFLLSSMLGIPLIFICLQTFFLKVWRQISFSHHLFSVTPLFQKAPFCAHLLRPS